MNGANKREYRVRSLQFIVDNQIIQKCNFPPSQFTDIDACHRRGKGLVFFINNNRKYFSFRVQKTQLGFLKIQEKKEREARWFERIKTNGRGLGNRREGTHQWRGAGLQAALPVAGRQWIARRDRWRCRSMVAADGSWKLLTAASRSRIGREAAPAVGEGRAPPRRHERRRRALPLRDCDCDPPCSQCCPMGRVADTGPRVPAHVINIHGNSAQPWAC